MTSKTKLLRLLLLGSFALVVATAVGQAPAAPAPTTPGSPARSVGTVKAIAGTSVTLTTDAGSEVKVSLQPPVTMVRTAPGRKDLQGAAPIQLQDIKPGDRMLVRGKLGDDGSTLVAASAIVMKAEDVAQKQQQERDDWRKRGINGVVKSIDPAAGTISVSTGGLAAKIVSVHVVPNTIIRRYAPDSVKFDDAKISTLAQMNAGDQLRARGDRSPDGNDFTAQEIVSGTFRNLAGTVVSTSAPDNTLTISDLLSKKQVTVKVGQDSQLRKLPPMIAQGMAIRLKGGTPGAPGSAGAAGGPGAMPPGAGAGGPPGGAGFGGPGGPGAAGRGQGDLQQMLARLPASITYRLAKG